MVANRRYIDLTVKLLRQFPRRIRALRHVPPTSVVATWVTPPDPGETALFNSIVAAHDWTPKRKRLRAAVKLQVQLLDAVSFRQLLNDVVTDWCIDNPERARLAGIDTEEDI